MLPGGNTFSDVDCIRYGKVSSISEIVFDKKSEYSFKEVLTPISQTLFFFTEDQCKKADPPKKGAIIFLRSCNINGRLRLTLEVIGEVRRVCGRDFIIDVRISGDEYSDGGLNINDATYVAKQLEKAGVYMIHVSGGTTIKRGSSIPAPGTKMGTHSELAAHIKKRVNVPVATVARITEAWIAEEMIANGMADACMIGRANLCEPEFANKAREGREHEIRPCIGCLRCLNGIMFGKRVACTINPSFELVNEDTLKEAEVKKNVLVIGGGVVRSKLAMRMMEKGIRIESGAKVGNIKDAISGAYELAGTL